METKALASAQSEGERIAWNSQLAIGTGEGAGLHAALPGLPFSGHGLRSPVVAAATPMGPQSSLTLLLSWEAFVHFTFRFPRGVSVKLLSSFCRFILENDAPLPAVAWKASWLSLGWSVPHLPVKQTHPSVTCHPSILPSLLPQPGAVWFVPCLSMETVLPEVTDGF